MRYPAVLIALIGSTLLCPLNGRGQCAANIFWNGGLPTAGTNLAQGTILGTVGVTVRSVGSFASGRPGYSNNTQTYGGYTWRSLMTFRGASFASGTYTSFKLQKPLTSTYIHIRVSDIRGDGFNTEHQRVRGFLNGVAVGVTFEDPVNGAFITGGNIINGASTTTGTVQSAMRAFFTGAVDSIVVSATGFSDYVIVDLFARCDLLLPYQLMSFNGRAGSSAILLTWEVAGETQVQGYRLERSADGRMWQEIAEIPASTETGPEKPYQFTDGSPLPGKNMYRLYSMEVNGRGQYSKVISIMYDPWGQASTHRLIPNPARDQFTIYVLGAAQRKPVVEILTIEGKTRKQFAMRSDVLTLYCTGWPRGLYLIRITGRDGFLQTEKLILQ